MFDRFTERARAVVAGARDVALARGHDRIEPAHVVIGLLDDPMTHASTILVSLGHDPAELRRLLDAVSPDRGEVLDIEGQLPFTVAGRRMLEASLAAAASLTCPYVGTEHLLLGLLETEDLPASRALRDGGVVASAVRREMEKLGTMRPTGWRPGFDLAGVCAAAMGYVTEVGIDRVGRAAMMAALLEKLDAATERAFESLAIDRERLLEALRREIRKDAGS